MKRMMLGVAALALLLGGVVPSAFGQSVLIIGADNPGTSVPNTNAATIQTILQTGSTTKATIFNGTFTSFGTGMTAAQVTTFLEGFNAVILLPTFDAKTTPSPSLDMTANGQAGLVAYVNSNKGGLVTTEWTSYAVSAFGYFSALSAILPVTSTTQFFDNSGGNSFSMNYNKTANNLPGGVPASFAFTANSSDNTTYGGYATNMAVKNGTVTTFYTATNGAGNSFDGVDGWASGNGHVISLSTLASPSSTGTDELSNASYQSLLIHAVDYADLSTTPEPSSLALLGIAAAGMFGNGWRKRRNAKAAIVESQPVVDEVAGV